jgi:uncharacterized protein YndB with AHSA1/START domain
MTPRGSTAVEAHTDVSVRLRRGQQVARRSDSMTETKSHVQHCYDRVVTADIEDVWRALTDPDERQQGYYDNVVESSWMPGEPVRYLDANGKVIVEGTVADVDAPHRLVHSFSFTPVASASAAGDPPSRVTWTMEPEDDGTRITLVHDGFETQNETWRAVEDGWEQMLESLAQLFDAEDAEED